jgi:hypothetical protein
LFWSTRFEDAHPLVATINSGVVTRVIDDEGKVTNYYGFDGAQKEISSHGTVGEHETRLRQIQLIKIYIIAKYR